MRTQSLIRSAYIKSRYLWILLILLGVAFQGMRRPDISEMELHLMDRFEMGITFAFALEIVWRFVGFLPDWRSFFRRSPGNLIDTGLVLSTLVLQLPVVKNNPVYPWLTILQLLRFYRVILVVPRMRPLLVSTIFAFLPAYHALAHLNPVERIRKYSRSPQHDDLSSSDQLYCRLVRRSDISRRRSGGRPAEL